MVTMVMVPSFGFLLLLLSIFLLATAYKVEMNEEITAKLSDLKRIHEQEAVEGAEPLSMEEEYQMMKELLSEMTQDPNFQEVQEEVGDEMVIGEDGETGGEPAPPNCIAFHGCNECIGASGRFCVLLARD